MDDRSGVRIPKACKPCAKAKVRCDPDPHNGPCKRCRRLNKECGGQAPGAHRRQRPTTSNIEIAALEAKLDRMVALLAASGRPSNDPSDAGPSPELSSATHPEEDAATPSEQEGYAFMEIFRTRMVPLFPFIVIPDDMTSEQLRQEKPFLYLNISMVACQESARQREISGIVKEYVAEHIVLRGEHSLDLLQGLLVHLAWFISISRLPRLDIYGRVVGIQNEDIREKTSGVAQLYAFVQLARAQAISLGLHQEHNIMRSIDKPLVYIGRLDLETDEIPARTVEERRAYLGCYYLNAMLSACVKDMEPLRFTKYTNDCCQILQEAQESPTDDFVVHLVRLMHLADKINRTFSVLDNDSSAILSAPLGMSIKWHQAEIQRLRASCSVKPPHSTILLFHYDTLELILYKIALGEELSDAEYGEYPVTRLDLLFRCLEATKSFFFNYYSLPSVFFPYLPFTSWCQFGQAIVALSRLSLYQSDRGEWDRTYVETTIDFNQTVEQLEQKLEEAVPFGLHKEKDLQSTEGRPEIYERLENRIHLMKETHRKRREALEQSQPEVSQALPDFSFMFNMPMSSGTFFPYTDFGELPDAFGAPM